MEKFTPVLLGTEIGAYGMARAFWERYQVKSVCFGTFPLTPTRHSKFIEQRCDADLMEPGRFVEVLNAAAPGFAGTVALIIPCGDEYSILLADHAAELDEAYVPVCSGPGILGSLNDKASFYALCERAGVPYPRTVVISGARVPDDLPFGFPVAVKPTDAAMYREHHFQGQKKAFVIEDRAMLEETVSRIYDSGYTAQLVIQDFIPGGDENMRVLNGYVRSDGKVALMSLGHPVLEDCAPMRIGNYAAIVSYGDDVVYDAVERLLDHVPYFGYFNLDLKWDSRDGSYKFLDFNPRQGRSSFFTTLSGHNLAQFAVEDLVEGKKDAPIRATEEVLWYGVPKSIVRAYAAEGPARDRAIALMNEGKAGTTLFGARDNDPRRLWNMAKLWVSYRRDFKRWFGHRELGE